MNTEERQKLKELRNRCYVYRTPDNSPLTPEETVEFIRSTFQELFNLVPEARFLCLWSIGELGPIPATQLEANEVGDLQPVLDAMNMLSKRMKRHVMPR